MMKVGIPIDFYLLITGKAAYSTRTPTSLLIISLFYGRRYLPD